MSLITLASIMQDMFIQSWSDPAQDESGPIRIFPATPDEWKDVEFYDLRTEGAFLVSAKRTGGKTEWIRIKSLAGEPCRVRPGLDGEVRIQSKGKHTLKQVSPVDYDIVGMEKGNEILLYRQWKALYEDECSDEEARFFGMTTNIDDNVGLLMKKLDNRNLTDNTLLIFMSDNGTSGGLDVYNYGMKGKKGTRVFLCGNLSQRTEGH